MRGLISCDHLILRSPPAMQNFQHGCSVDFTSSLTDLKNNLNDYFDGSVFTVVSRTYFTLLQ